MAQQNNLVGTLVELAAVVGVAYAVYEWLKVQCADPASLMQGTSPCSMFDNVFGITAPIVAVAGSTSSTGSSTASSALAAQTTAEQQAATLLSQQAAFLAAQTPAQQASAIIAAGQADTGTQSISAVMTSLAGTGSLTPSQWNSYLAQLGNGSISAAQLQSAFPNSSATMTAAAFIQGLLAAGLSSTLKAILTFSGGNSPYGLSSLPGGGMGLPRNVIHHPGRGFYR